jgi:hypothetical protein
MLSNTKDSIAAAATLLSIHGNTSFDEEAALTRS